MAIVPDNVGRLSLIAQKSTNRADRLAGERQADKAQMHQSLQNLGSTLQRGRLATQAEEGMMERQLVGQEFAAGEAGLERGFRTGERVGAEEFEAGLIGEERATYEDGTFTDSQTGKTYNWKDRQTYDAAMRQLEADRQRDWLKLQAALKDKPEEEQNRLLTAFDEIVNRTYGDMNINEETPLTFGQMGRDKAVAAFHEYLNVSDFGWLTDEDRRWMTTKFESWLDQNIDVVPEPDPAGGRGTYNFFGALLGGAEQITSALAGDLSTPDKRQIFENFFPSGNEAMDRQALGQYYDDYLAWTKSPTIPEDIQGDIAAGQTLQQMSGVLRNAQEKAATAVVSEVSDAKENAFSLLKTLNANSIPASTKNDPAQMDQLVGYINDIADGTFSDTVMNNFLRLIGRGGTTAAPRL